MPDTQVSILKRDGTQSIYYATYALARAAAVSDDVIQIWAETIQSYASELNIKCNKILSEKSGAL